MSDKHSYSFFGKKVALIILSPSKKDPHIFFRSIKKNDDGTWEKPSNGEGKIIKFSLEEMVEILQVIKHKVESWSGFHSFKGNKTQITFEWKNDQESHENELWIFIDNYTKKLNLSQTIVLKMLMKHLVKEKIKHATISQDFQKINKNPQNTSNKIKEENSVKKQPSKKTLVREEVTIDNKECIRLEGSIKAETPKALLINFASGEELWIPKSKIHSKFESTKDLPQSFIIDNWVLEKSEIIA